MTITTTITKNPRQNKLLTLYREFEYQIIDFVVNSFKISKQCGKMVRDEAASSQNLTPKWRECFQKHGVTEGVKFKEARTIWGIGYTYGKRNT